jgi:hypothetical protein
MKKAKKSITKPKDYAIKASGDYDCIFAFRQRPTSNAEIERIADEVVYFFDTNEDAYNIRAYLRKKRLSYQTFLDYAARNQKLTDAYAWAKMVIAERRERGGLTGKLNASIVLSSQRIYDEDYVKRDHEIADLKTKIADAGKPNYVITEIEMPKAEETQEVTDKKTKDEQRKVVTHD